MSLTYPERSEVKVCDPVLSAKETLAFSGCRAGYNGILATGNRSPYLRTVAGQNDNSRLKMAPKALPKFLYLIFALKHHWYEKSLYD